MNIDDIITLTNNDEYLILDVINLDENKYLYCVKIDKDENPMDIYLYLKAIEENGENFVEYIKDDDILSRVTASFAENFVKESKDDEQDA